MAKTRAEISKSQRERNKAGLVKLKPYITKEQDVKFNLVLEGKAKIVITKEKTK